MGLTTRDIARTIRDELLLIRILRLRGTDKLELGAVSKSPFAVPRSLVIVLAFRAMKLLACLHESVPVPKVFDQFAHRCIDIKLYLDIWMNFANMTCFCTPCMTLSRYDSPSFSVSPFYLAAAATIS